MGLLTNWKDNKKINSYIKEYEQLSLEGKHKEALKIIENALNEFSENLSLIYCKAKELIANRDIKSIERLFEQINKLSEEKIKETGIKKVIWTDLIIKNERDLNDKNFDPLISDEDLSSRESIKNSKQFIETIVRRSYYMCLKYNGRNIRETIVHYPAKQIRFLAELNMKYCPGDKAWVLQWFYKEGMYAVERGIKEYKKGNIGLDKREYEYALEILNEYISLTKDNKDDMAHNKYYSRGLAYFNLGKYKLAINDFKTSLKFTKDKAMIKEVNNILEEAKKRIND